MSWKCIMLHVINANDTSKVHVSSHLNNFAVFLNVSCHNNNISNACKAPYCRGIISVLRLTSGLASEASSHLLQFPQTTWYCGICKRIVLCTWLDGNIVTSWPKYFFTTAFKDVAHNSTFLLHTLYMQNMKTFRVHFVWTFNLIAGTLLYYYLITKELLFYDEL